MQTKNNWGVSKRENTIIHENLDGYDEKKIAKVGVLKMNAQIGMYHLAK